MKRFVCKRRRERRVETFVRSFLVCCVYIEAYVFRPWFLFPAALFIVKGRKFPSPISIDSRFRKEVVKKKKRKVFLWYNQRYPPRVNLSLCR